MVKASSSLLRAIIVCSHLTFFRIFSNFGHFFADGFRYLALLQHFFALFLKISPMPLLSRIGPSGDIWTKMRCIMKFYISLWDWDYKGIKVGIKEIPKVSSFYIKKRISLELYKRVIYRWEHTVKGGTPWNWIEM